MAATSPVDSDSPLSITASIAGILTLLVAIGATIYARLTYLSNSDDEYFRVKAALSWYKTESTWLSHLAKATLADSPLADSAPDGPSPVHSAQANPSRRSGQQTEHEMYAFVMDDLAKLERRLLELVTETELRAASNLRQSEESWALVPRSWGFTTGVAMAWLPVRRKALELVRQRDALGARVQFTQMSMLSSGMRELEARAKWRDGKNEETLRRLERTVTEQRAKIQGLEDVLHRLALEYGTDLSLISPTRQNGHTTT